jgi:D-aminopeptidase
MEGIETGFDAAMFIRYHARAGTRNATIDQTYTLAAVD